MYVIIAGGGALGREVAETLLERRHDVVVIDRHKPTCDAIYAELGAVSVHGSGTNLHVLREAGGERAELLVTAMPLDADNIACALLGRSLGVARIIGRLRDTSYEAAYEVAGFSHLVRATHLLRKQIMLHIDHPQVEEIVALADDAAQIFSIRVPPGGLCAGRRVLDIASEREFPRGCLLIGLRRGGSGALEVPRGSTQIHAGDTVMVIAAGGDIEKAVGLLMRS